MLGALLNILAKLLPSALPRLVTERPDLLIDHAQAYAALVKNEIDFIKRQWIRRIVAAAVAFSMALAFVILTGVALMLNATVAINSETGWLLLAIPFALLVVTIISARVATAKLTPSTQSLSAQIQLDLQAIRAATEPR
jgi:thiosulfate reductase cytochrome b subunit